jgi:hypothetical protein
MIAQRNIDQIGKEPGVLQEPPLLNRNRRLLSFKAFRAEQGRHRLHNTHPVAKPVSEEIVGNFNDGDVSDAIYCYMSMNTADNEKQIVADEIAEKVVSMSQSANVILVAVSVS